jgi:hypothetical protein
MSLVAQAFRSTKGRIVLGVIAAWAGFQLWLTLAAPGKISPELTGTSEKVNVQIELPFTPERFHVLAFHRTTWRQNERTSTPSPGRTG